MEKQFSISAPPQGTKTRDSGWRTLDEDPPDEPPQVIDVPISSIESKVTAKLLEMVQERSENPSSNFTPTPSPVLPTSTMA